MTKTILALTAALCCAQDIGFAQTASGLPHAHLLKTIESRPPSAKTNTNGSRLLAVTTRRHDGNSLVIEDSSRCTYGGPAHGYDFEVGQWKFSNAMIWEHDGSSYNDYYRVNQTIDASGRIEASHAEVYYQGQWYDEEFINRAYDANGKILADKEAYFDGSTWDSTRSAYTYNATGALLSITSEDYNDMTMQWENNYKIIHTYTNGLLTETLTQSWYNGQWENSYRSTHTYANNLRTESFSEQYVNGNWENGGQNLFTYDANGNLLTEENKGWQNGGWQPQNRVTHTYDLNNDRTATVRENYVMGSYMYYMRTLFTNNSHHQSVLEVEEGWNMSTSQFEQQVGNAEQRYYYEEFTNSVKDAKVVGGSLNLYPNPSYGILHMRASFAEPVEADAVMTDAAGRLVKQIHMPSTALHSTVIDISTLSPGVYMLNLHAGGRMMAEKFVVSE